MGDNTLAKKIGKVLLHARENNTRKFLKYLLLVRPHKRKVEDERRKEHQEIILRKKGALEAIAVMLDRILSTPLWKDILETEEIDARKSIINESMSILGNAFLLDAVAKRQSIEKKIFQTIHRILEHPDLSSDKTIQRRALKCLGNLCLINHPDDIKWSHDVIRSGVITSIFRIIAHQKKELKMSTEAELSAMAGVPYESVPVLDVGVLGSAVRAIRSMAGDPDVRTVLLRHDALVIIGIILTWPQLRHCRDFTKEVLRAMTELSRKFRTARHEVVFQLKTEGEPVLAELVRMLDSDESENLLALHVIPCLTNLAANKEIVSVFRKERIFNVLFRRIGVASKFAFSLLEAATKLLRELVTQDSVILNYLVPHSAPVDSTMRILKTPALDDYHYFILNFYDHLEGCSIPDMAKLGLIELLETMLKESYKEVTYESLRSLIYTTESDSCPVHSKGGRQTCRFIPVYRCTSPSYLQVQKEVKEYLNSCHRPKYTIDVEPGWSPRSISCKGLSDDETTGGSFSPCTSGRVSPISSTVGSDDDEGVGGESNVFPDEKFEFSEGEECSYITDSSRRAFKRRRLNQLAAEDGHSESFTGNGYTSKARTILEQLKKIKTIAAIVGILKKLARLPSLQPDLLSFTPVLLALLCEGKLSCMSYEASEAGVGTIDEIAPYNKRCFYGSYSILRHFFLEPRNFQYFLESGLIPLLFRLTLSGKEQEPLNEEVQKCNSMLHRLLPVLGGEENHRSPGVSPNDAPHNTRGWRKGILKQNLTGGKFQQEAVLAIPLLYQADRIYFRECEQAAEAWSKLLSTLGQVDEIPTALFQDSITALATLCTSLGMRWTEGAKFGNQSQLAPESMEDIDDDENDLANDTQVTEQGPKVIFELKDGESLSLSKESLTKASPVFAAMFDGYFLEAEEQRVKLPETTKRGLLALSYQIGVRGKELKTKPRSPPTPSYDVPTVFELLSLSDRFLLHDIREKTFNSILGSYLCPYSAPLMYELALTSTTPLDLEDSNHKPRLEFDFGKIVLKYLLAGEGINCRLRAAAFKKIFDSIEPRLVLKDLTFLFEHYSKSDVRFSPSNRIRMRNIMLKV